MDFGEILNGLALTLIPEVFFIGNLVLAIPVFVVCYVIAKKKVAPEKRRKYAFYRTIFMTPITFFTLAFLFFTIMLSYRHTNFDAETWRQNHTTRYKMTKDLIKSKTLIGKTKQETLDLLGELDWSRNDTTRRSIYYSIGYLPRVMNMSPDDILEIEFEDGKVSNVYQTRVRERSAAWAAERKREKRKY